MSSFPSFYVSCLGRGMTLHGKTEGRVGVDWGNSFHYGAHFFFFKISHGSHFQIFMLFLSCMSYYTYITPHDKSCYRYIPIDFSECVDIITSINLALGCCFALPSNCMEEKKNKQCNCEAVTNLGEDYAPFMTSQLPVSTTVCFGTCFF